MVWSRTRRGFGGVDVALGLVMGGSGAQSVESVAERGVRVADVERVAVVLDPYGGAVPHAACLRHVGAPAELVDQVGGDFDMSGAHDLALRASEDLVAHGGQAGEILGLLDRPAVALHAGAPLVHPLGGLPDGYLRVAFDRLCLCELAAIVQLGLDLRAGCAAVVAVCWV